MHETKRMISTLKRCLRAKGMTYRDLARAIGLSESSVKRLFAEETFTLTRFERICGALEMTVADLVRTPTKPLMVLVPNSASFFTRATSFRDSIAYLAEIVIAACNGRVGGLERMPECRQPKLVDTSTIWRLSFSGVSQDVDANIKQRPLCATVVRTDCDVRTV